MNETSNNNATTIPVDWNDPEFQKKFVQAFNMLEARVSILEKLTEPLAKQAKIEQLQLELDQLKKYCK